MKFRRLTIHNIASIADAEIDFSAHPLADEALFLISGETGSGKSTILDCICLALYGTTPRMVASQKKEAYHTGGDKEKKVNVNDERQLLRRGTGEASVNFTFEGSNGGSYLAEVVIYRARKKANGDLQNLKWRLTREDTHQTFDKKEQIRLEIRDHAVGLDFSQFCRTVMLAQGQFGLFLNGASKEKSEILEKLTDTSVYARISRHITACYNDAKQAHGLALARLEGVTLLTEEEIGELNRKIDELKREHSALEAQKTALDAQIEWLDRNSQLTQRRQEAELKHSRSHETLENPETRQQAALVEQWQATAEVRVHLRQLIEAERNLNRKKEEKTALETRLHRLASALARQRAGLPTELASLKADDIERDIEKNRIETQQTQNDISALQPDEIANRRVAATQRQQRLNDLVRAAEHCSSAQKLLADAQARLAEQQRDAGIEEARLPQLEQTKRQADEEYQRANDDYNRISLSLSDWAREARQRLRAGDACPVCGNIIEQALGDEAFESALAPYEKERDERRKAAQEAAVQLSTQKNLISQLRQALAKTQKSINTSEQPDADRAHEDLARLRRQAECPDTVADLAAWITQTTDALEAEMKRLDEQQKRVNQLNERLNALRDSAEALGRARELAQVDTLLRSIGSTLGVNPQPGNSATEVNNLPEECRLLESDIRAWQLNAEHLENAREKSLTAVNAFTAQHPDIGRTRLETLNAIPESEIHSINARLTEIRKAHQEAVGALQAIDSQLAELARRRPADLPENPQLEAMRNSSEEIRQQLINLEHAKGEYAGKLRADDEQRRRKGEITVEVDRLKDEANQWESLHKEIGEVNNVPLLRTIAQGFILGDLLDKANVFMRQFNDRYTLTCQHNSLTILLQDTTTGDISSVATFSGGEGFMAALALALALSQMSSGSRMVDTLFIDEGFGSLSSEYLERVTATLRQMHRAGGRRVGIISHVARLRETIPTIIHVERGAGRSAPSSISISR